MKWGRKHRWVRPVLALAVLIAVMLPLSLVAQTEMPANLHPIAAQMAVESPEGNIRLVVQKADETERATALASSMGGEFIRELGLLNAFVVEMPAGNAPKLARSPLVNWISVDGQISSSGYLLPISLGTNYFRETTRAATFQEKAGLLGEGIGVAVIDSGVDDTHDCIDVVAAPFGSGDEFGHGTHVAGIIACDDADFPGIAPEVDLISLKVFDANGLAYESDVVAAMEWIYNNKDAYNIRVVNMSFNSTLESSYHESYMNAAAELLWFNGIVVVTSVGNKGPAGGYNTTKTAPANDPFFIAVGASDEKDNSDRNNDEYAPFASAGLTLDGHAKPDVVTPGYNIISALSTESSWGTDYPERLVSDYYGDDYIKLSGTSMAAPIMTGGVAVLLDYKPDLTPDQVKYIITEYTTMMPHGEGEAPYLDVYQVAEYLMSLRKKSVVPSANTGEIMNKLLHTGEETAWDTSVAWNSVAWNSVAWNSVAWNSVAWNSVAWNSVAWNSVAWNSVELNGVFWGPTRGPKK